MKLKGKLITGIVFFFLLLLSVAGAALYFNHRLKTDAKAIVQDNYESLEYCHQMQQLLNERQFTDSMGKVFEQQLKQQSGNITEPGEGTATQQLVQHYRLFGNHPSDSLRHIVQQDIQRIIAINMQAISKKNTVAIRTANDASDWIKILCAFISLVGFTFVINFPGIIIGPITRLQEGIAEIMNKNFKHRILLQGKDELAALGNAFNTMAARLDEYESSSLSRLMFEKSRAEAVVNSLQDASVGVDATGRILFANQQALDLLGAKAKDLVGTQVDKAIQRNDLLKFLIQNDTKAPFKIVVAGREQFFIKEVSAIKRDEELLGNLYSIRNITNFQEKDTARINFIAMVSHELKTPLASIRMSADLLEHEKVGNLNAEQKDLVSSIRDDAARLLKITGELLNMSQVETGHMEMHLAPEPVKALVDYALHANKLPADDKQLQLQQNVAADLPTVQVDAEKTIWIISNLLSNAIRHAPNGSMVKLQAAQEDKWVTVSVTDAGTGIAPEYKDRIFERYFRIPGSAKGGTGLGLSTSKEMVTAMGGKISVWSELGKGSRFTIHLPIAT